MRKIVMLFTILSIFLVLFCCYFFLQHRQNKAYKTLKLSKIEIADSVLDSIKIKLNLSLKAGVILRINEFDCNACVDFELDNLKILPENLKNRILLLSSFKNIRALNILLSRYNIQVPVINHFEQIPNILQENIGKPYYFTIDEYGYITNFHVSKIEDSNSTIAYFQNINEYIINSGLNEVNDNILFNKICYDLGNININTNHKVDFTLENLSHEVLIIENVTATCGCTSVNWERKPIRPGTKTKIEVDYHAYSKGFFYKKIMIIFSNGYGIRVLSIKGNVI